MVLGLRQFTDRTGDGPGQPVLNTGIGKELMHVQPGVSIVLGNRSPETPGTLFITNKKVVWLSDVNGNIGYAVDFLSVSLHAVSRDPEAYSSPCIYTLVLKLKMMEMNPRARICIVFLIFCQCAELNPDPADEGEDEGNNWIFSADRMTDEAADWEDLEWFISPNPSSIGHSNGHSDLARTVLELQINDQWFEDGEDMEHEDQSGHQ